MKREMCPRCKGRGTIETGRVAAFYCGAMVLFTPAVAVGFWWAWTSALPVPGLWLVGAILLSLGSLFVYWPLVSYALDDFGEAS